MGDQPQFTLWSPSTSGDLGMVTSWLFWEQLPLLRFYGQAPCPVSRPGPKGPLVRVTFFGSPFPTFQATDEPRYISHPLPGLYFPLTHTLSPSDRLGYTYI